MRSAFLNKYRDNVNLFCSEKRYAPPLGTAPYHISHPYFPNLLRLNVRFILFTPLLLSPHTAIYPYSLPSALPLPLPAFRPQERSAGIYDKLIIVSYGKKIVFQILFKNESLKKKKQISGRVINLAEVSSGRIESTVID